MLFLLFCEDGKREGQTDQQWDEKGTDELMVGLTWVGQKPDGRTNMGGSQT